MERLVEGFLYFGLRGSSLLVPTSAKLAIGLREFSIGKYLSQGAFGYGVWF